MLLWFPGTVAGQSVAHDPGPRGGSIDAGGPITVLVQGAIDFFNDGKSRFTNSEGLANGLGPTFNGDSCGICHSQPATGGTSPKKDVFPNVGDNPQVALATLNGALNKLPFFVTADGPVREARFKFVVDSDGSVDRNEPDGSVHDLFTIRGRTDPGINNTCDLQQEDFERARDQNNLALRIPTPTFGGGLIEAIDEATILSNMQANQQEKLRLGIRGVPNRSGNDATITRFGWKAQNKSLIMFSHEAYSVEVGETNQMFPQKRGFFPNPPPANCVLNVLPEDQTNYGANTEVGVPSDDDQFSTFMRFLDQPKPSTTTPGGATSIANGSAYFSSVGCALCHTPTLVTGKSAFGAGLTNIQANLFSDLLLHHMGTGLNDGISQGNAGPDQFRTAPLWGLGQRIFFLHDGRTSDLLKAIEDHASPGSEANQVIRAFHALAEAQKQDLLNFLRSL